MARIYDITWNVKQHRWFKKYRGKQFAVSPKELGTEATKEASYRAANDWWRSKKAELDAQPASPREPADDAIELLTAKRDWCREHGEPAEAEQFAAKLAALQASRDNEEALKELPLSVKATQLAELMQRCGLGVPTALLEFASSDGVDPNELVWQDRLKHQGTPSVPPDLTVNAQVENWLGVQKAKAEGGEIAADRYDNLRCAVHSFRDFVGSGQPVTDIKEATLDSYFSHLMSKVAERRRSKEGREGFSADYATSLFGIARRFIKWCWTRRLIELPRNIESTDHRFGKGARKVETFQDEDIKTLLGKAGDRLKLYLLLMLNCGMLQKDISDLRHDEVDWTLGRIRRKRSKTRDHDDVPEVDYKLWPETFRLLKACRSDPKMQESVLVTEKGKPLMPKGLAEDGRLTKSDNIQSAYRYLGKRLGILKPKALKLLRKTSASKLESHGEYGRYVSHFLGHAPRTVKDRHYAAPSCELFDRAIDWLGKQYGLA
jgi:hypothetical protein